jgi:hypothetical protein
MLGPAGVYTELDSGGGKSRIRRMAGVCNPSVALRVEAYTTAGPWEVGLWYANCMEGLT